MKLSEGGVTYYAQWTANDQSVNFDANGGSTDQKAISGKTDATVDLSGVKGATRAGYTFKGWYTSKDGDTEMPANVKLSEGGVTYYAQWTANGRNKDNSNSSSGHKKPIKSSKPNLPSTGEQEGNILYTLGGIIIFLAIVLYAIVKNRRRNK